MRDLERSARIDEVGHADRHAGAPARINSAASSPVMTPPTPLMGISTAWATSQTMRTAMWWHSGPERPPLGLATRDLRVWTSMAMPWMELMTERPSAPAASRLGDLGDVDRSHLHEQRLIGHLAAGSHNGRGALGRGAHGGTAGGDIRAAHVDLVAGSQGHSSTYISSARTNSSTEWPAT